MASYNVQWKQSAAKELRKLPAKQIASILTAVESLADNPRKAGVVKLMGSEQSYRLRVGNYRVVFEIIDRVLLVEIVRVAHRKEVYR